MDKNESYHLFFTSSDLASLIARGSESYSNNVAQLELGNYAPVPTKEEKLVPPVEPGYLYLTPGMIIEPEDEVWVQYGRSWNKVLCHGSPVCQQNTPNAFRRKTSNIKADLKADIKAAPVPFFNRNDAHICNRLREILSTDGNVIGTVKDLVYENENLKKEVESLKEKLRETETACSVYRKLKELLKVESSVLCKVRDMNEFLKKKKKTLS